MDEQINQTKPKQTDIFASTPTSQKITATITTEQPSNLLSKQGMKKNETFNLTVRENKYFD